jgi:hypothetical protein
MHTIVPSLGRELTDLDMVALGIDIELIFKILER